MDSVHAAVQIHLSSLGKSCWSHGACSALQIFFDPRLGNVSVFWLELWEVEEHMRQHGLGRL